MALLQIQDLHVSIQGKEILKGITMDIRDDEIHAVMGPNGSGKSTLSYVIMGHPEYTVTQGDILFEGSSILELSPDERSKKGIFLSFQYPLAIPGVTVANFLRTAMNAHRTTDLSVVECNTLVKEKMTLLGMDASFLTRYLNDGFSGGEKKRMEILQMAMLSPRIAILDETDSGTDVDALRVIADGINAVRSRSKQGILLITHYERILKLLVPDRVSVLLDGRIVETGDAHLAAYIEQNGYKKYFC